MVSAIRMLASSDGEVVAANWWGKIKTGMQMVAVISILLAAHLFLSDEAAGSIVRFWSSIVMWILALVTAVSGFVYVYENRRLINNFE